MMSTFSRVSGNQEGDDDDDDPTASTSSFQNLPVDTSISQPSDSLVSTVTNGTADESITSATSAAISDGKVITKVHAFYIVYQAFNSFTKVKKQTWSTILLA